MNILDHVIDGIKVRDFDLNKFRTETALRDWLKSVSRSVFSPDDFSRNRIDASEALQDHVQAVIEKMRAASEARKLSMPPRNLSLVIVGSDNDRDESMNYNNCGFTAQNLYYQHFDMFVRAEQMTAYEFDGYATLGDAECERQGIETLHDMFGTEFAERFYQRKHYLIARDRLKELCTERDILEAEIAKVKNVMSDLM